MRAQVCRIKKLYSSFHVREAPPEKRVLFGTIDPNVGGWGRMDPSFYKSQFFMAYFTLFLPKISGKFTVKVPNL